ncbi:GPI ethanolamine phosphate transferase, stabilizing subunit-like [Ciona intestinalis]
MLKLLTYIIPELTLLLCAVGYFVIPNYVLGTDMLINSPIYTTLIFSCGYAILQFLLLHFVWPKAKEEIETVPTIGVKQQTPRKSRRWFKSLLLVVACWLLAHILCVLFGAAAFTLVEETTTWAVLVTCLITVPALSMLGCDVTSLYRVIVCGNHSNETERFLYYQSAGTALGSWASAVVIPLDWDRPWQVWPIPCIIGAIVGYSVGIIISCVVTIRELKTVKVL